MYFPFLDEAPEFHPRVLEALREPLESGDIALHRARGVTHYPARFQLVLAANPCPCGRAWGRGEECTCSAQARRRYMARLSGPILDRVDIRVQVPKVTVAVGDGFEAGEPSAVIAERVRTARERQAERFTELPIATNAQIPGPLLRGAMALSRTDRAILQRMLDAGSLTMRGHDRVVRIAWTIADLLGADRPDSKHVDAALELRGDDR